MMRYCIVTIMNPSTAQSKQNYRHGQHTTNRGSERRVQNDYSRFYIRKLHLCLHYYLNKEVYPM